MPAPGVIAPRSASSARRWTAAIWSSRGVADRRLVGSIVAASPRPSVRKSDVGNALKRACSSP